LGGHDQNPRETVQAGSAMIARSAARISSRRSAWTQSLNRAPAKTPRPPVQFIIDFSAAGGIIPSKRGNRKK
ncbi:MAG: hypothetical protein ACREDY_22370, partial [Bradyrhizobium sp.]